MFYEFKFRVISLGTYRFITAHKVTDRARRAAIYTVVPELRTDLPAAVAAAAIEDDKIRGLVPAEYHEFLPLFKKAIADVLPLHRPYDHKIMLKEGFSPPLARYTPSLGSSSKPYGSGLTRISARGSSAPHLRRQMHQSCSSKNAMGR